MSEIWSQLLDGGVGLLFDLVIVSYLVYVVLLLIRGTRTVPMALGLLVILILVKLETILNCQH